MHTFFHDISLLFIQNEWLANIVFIILGMAIFHWVSRKIHHLLLAKLDDSKHVWTCVFIKSVHVPWLTFFWLLAFSFVAPPLILHTGFGLPILGIKNTLRSLFFMGALYWSLMNFIKGLEEKIAPRWAHMPIRDKTTVRAIAQLSRVVLTILTVLAVLPMLGFPVGGLLAFGGAGGIAAAFAAKDMLANFLGGMMIFWDRPFAVGDWISSPDRNIQGTVEHIGWRLTRIRTFSKRPLYVPNSVFSSIVIENPSRMTNRRIEATIGLRYDDANAIAPIMSAIKEMLENHPDLDTTLTTMVNFNEFGPSSLNFNLYAFTKTTDWVKYRDVQQDVFLKTIAIIAAHGAECAFPTTTMHVPNTVHISETRGDYDHVDRTEEPG